MSQTYTSPWMNPELEVVRDNVRRFFAEEVVPHQERWYKQHHVDRELWYKAGELGLLALDMPEEYGGSGGNFAHLAVFFEEQAAVGDWGFGVQVHHIVSHYILNHGTEEQKHKYLPKMASGEMIGSIAMTEPGTGSDLQGIRTRAVREGDQYVINGAKTFISNGSMADLVVVVTKTEPNAGSKGMSLIIVETKDCAGFSVGRVLEKLGQHNADTSELAFQDVRVPAANLLGGVEGQGMRQLMSDLAYERVGCSVGSAASIERAVRLTLEYTRERKAFGKPLLDMQNTRFKLAECDTQATLARVFIDNCIQRMLDGSMDPVTASKAKLWMTETQGKVIDECLQLFGGYGYMMEYPIARMYADARVQRIYAGTSEIMKEIIARSF
ncbi:acyl-CoA dehydrogenase family protein [Pseudomonas sp. LS44]|uniref:acyl-CoA dehydrogenase family protein n=1 Tax=Pseudomonas sp. LS44 TaxID=1357074 RepID=UPI00215AF64B|nr:acyl-CoA dehydrogenase family protein [Pseudomonas sp. LS44]UVE16032.1 acyl-CoA dehydrogenase family protein [Pseudomonas sp. LS44]